MAELTHEHRRAFPHNGAGFRETAGVGWGLSIPHSSAAPTATVSCAIDFAPEATWQIRHRPHHHRNSNPGQPIAPTQNANAAKSCGRC